MQVKLHNFFCSNAINIKSCRKDFDVRQNFLYFTLGKKW